MQIVERSRFPVAPYQYLARTGSGHTPSRSVEAYWRDTNTPWLTTSDVKYLRAGVTQVLYDTEHHISELGMANSSACLHPAGTVALSRTASVGFSVIMGVSMATSQDFVTWTPGPDMDSRYLLWVLRAMKGSGDFDSLMYGSTHNTIYVPDLQRLRGPVPPVEVQRRIADYLDTETVRIESLEERLRHLDRLLMERRTAATLNGVVGLATSDEERRPTELPWAASLPASWDVAAVAHVARLGSGHTPSRNRPELWRDCTIPWVTTGEVSQMRSDRLEYLRDTREKISELGIRESSARLHAANSVVLCRTAASAGYSAILGKPMATSQDIVVWTCGPKLRPRYLLLCLRAMRRDLLDRLATGSTHKTIYMPDVEALRIPLPPVGQQNAIVDVVWKQLHMIDSLRDVLVQQQRLLAERRQAMITAAVTGEIEV